MNKLAVIAAFLALSSCATLTDDPASPEESPPRESAPSTESESVGASEETPGSVPDAPLPEAPDPEAPDPEAPGPDAADPGLEAEDAEAAVRLSEPDAPPDTDIPRLTAPRSAADEARARALSLAAPSLPPAPDAPTPAAQPEAPGPDPEPRPEPEPETGPEPDPEPEPEPARAPPRQEREPRPEPEPTRPAPTRPERQPEPDPAPEPDPEPRREPLLSERNDTPTTARQPAPPVSGTREAVVGDEVRLSLGDGGWVYLGEESGEDGLSFRRRYSENGETVFVFTVEAPGDYVVRFQRQDLDRGVFREERVAVDARPEPAAGAEPAASAPEAEISEETSRSETPDASAPSVDLDEAYALLEEGRREAALDAFLQSYPVGDPEVHGLIARLAYELGRWETARSHWSRNLDAGEPFARNARLGLFRTALETGDAEAAWELFGQMDGEGSTDGAAPVPGDRSAADLAGAAAPDITEAELLRLGNLLLESADPSRAVGPLEAYMDAGGTSDDPAELYYRLGRLHEDRRDARAAMEYYRRVVDEFPLSRYWQRAEERVQYLRRHFFDIR
jgi:tetratricopeptide (TPR) repeat protein